MTATDRPPTATEPRPPAASGVSPSRVAEGVQAEHAAQDRPAQATADLAPHLSAAALASVRAPALHPGDTFELCFTATPRGARLARRLASLRAYEWGHPYGSSVNDAVTLVVAELSANAVTHGLVPGRDALLRLTRSPGRLLVEVVDTRGERLPTAPADRPSADAENGRGLMLVDALAGEWGVTPRDGAPGKTVWAVIPRDSP